MRITIVMPSRGNPKGLLSVLTALDALATGSHEITYALVIDTDDADTRGHITQWQTLDMLPRNTHAVLGDPSKNIFARINEIAGAFAAESYFYCADDVIPLTQHWDSIFDGLKDVLPGFSWQEKNDPGNATYLVITEKWRRAIGRMLPERFPFWFIDTWLMEVHLLAFAKPIGIIQQLQLGGKRGKTHRMRELPFWFRLFTATRSERIAEAQVLAKEYGFTVDVMRERTAQISQLEQIDAQQLKDCQKYTALLGDDSEPDENYLTAKAEALAWLEEHERRILIPVGPQIEVIH